MIPFYVFYSMFGFQRIGDLIWAAADSRSRGFLIGATAGRTTLAGEGLQHQDGHSLLQAATIPNCIAYDPTFAYELAVIIHDGLKRMYERQDNVFYYITVMNENYVHPALPDGAREGILRGMYRVRASAHSRRRKRAHLFGSGAILNEALKAQQVLEACQLLGLHVPDEVAVLRQTHEQQLARFQADPAAAKALIAVGESKAPESADPVGLAAMTAVANVLLNLNETITK